MMNPTERQFFSDGSSFNPALGTITFGLTLPAQAAEGCIKGEIPSPKAILCSLARSIETQGNPLAKSALKAVFDCIYERTTERERQFFPNWFDSR